MSAARLPGRRAAQLAALLTFVALALPGVGLASDRREAAILVALAGGLVALPLLLRVRTLRDLRRAWFWLVAGVLLGTLFWDVATALVLGRRGLLSEWPIVYASSLLTFALIYVVQVMLGSVLAVVLERLRGRRRARS